MMKLIKGELYRFIHSGRIFWYIIIASIATTALIIYADHRALHNDLAYFAGEFAGISQAIQPLLLAIFIPASVSRMYRYKTGYYEVMDGSGSALIILSKLIVYGVSTIVIYMLPIAVFLTVIGISNGAGEIDIPMFVLLYLLITMRVVFASVMFTMIAKNGASSFLCYVRYMILETAGAELLVALFPKHAETIAEVFTWFPMIQLPILGNMLTDMDGEFIMKVVVGFAVETALWFVWAFFNYRNKRFA